MMLEQVDDGEDTKWDGARDGGWKREVGGGTVVGVEIRDASGCFVTRHPPTLVTPAPRLLVRSTDHDCGTKLVRRYGVVGVLGHMQPAVR